MLLSRCPCYCHDARVTVRAKRDRKKLTSVVRQLCALAQRTAQLPQRISDGELKLKRLLLSHESVDLICDECSVEQLQRIRTSLAGRDKEYLEATGLPLVHGELKVTLARIEAEDKRQRMYGGADEEPAKVGMEAVLEVREGSRVGAAKYLD